MVTTISEFFFKATKERRTKISTDKTQLYKSCFWVRPWEGATPLNLSPQASITELSYCLITLKLILIIHSKWWIHWDRFDTPVTKYSRPVNISGGCLTIQTYSGDASKRYKITNFVYICLFCRLFQYLDQIHYKWIIICPHMRHKMWWKDNRQVPHK